MKINFKEKLKKYLSLSQVGFQRHPLGWIFGNLGMLVGLLKLREIFTFEDSLLFSLLSALSLGVFLSLVADLYKEHNNPPVKNFSLFSLILTLVLMSFFGRWCHTDYSRHAEVFWFQWWAIMSMALLLIFMAYKPNSKSLDKSFFFIGALSKSIFGGLFLGVLLAAGLGIILFTVEKLFEIPIPNKLWADLWMVFVLIMPFNFFLGLLDEELSSTFQELKLNRILEKVFEWILPGLLLVYLLIILSYGLKILVEGALPNGLVGGMVLGYLSVLFVALLGQIFLKKKLNPFYRIFTFSSPLVALLFAIAIKERINEHGLTEGRFLWIALALTLIASILFIEKSPLKVIWRFVLMSLLGGFLFALGPWGFSGAVKANQMERLNQKFTEEEMLINGKLSFHSKEIHWDKAYNLGANLKFILERYGIEPLKPILEDSIYQNLKPFTHYELKTRLFESLNIPKIGYWEYRNSSSLKNKHQDFTWYRPNSVKMKNEIEFDIKGPIRCKEIDTPRKWGEKLNKVDVVLDKYKGKDLLLDPLALIQTLEIKNNRSEYMGNLSQQGLFENKSWVFVLRNLSLFRGYGQSNYELNGIEGLFCIEK